MFLGGRRAVGVQILGTRRRVSLQFRNGVAISPLKSKVWDSNGVLAQLVERLNGIEEVRGSNPLGSILPSKMDGG